MRSFDEERKERAANLSLTSAPPPTMTMGEATMMGGKAKERTEGEDVSMVTICQGGQMLKGEMGLHEAARNGDTVTLEKLLGQG